MTRCFSGKVDRLLVVFLVLVIVFGMTSACSVIREHQEKKQQELEEEIAFNEQKEEQIVRYLNNSVDQLSIDREQQAAAPDLSEITFQDLLIYLDDDTITDLQNSSSLDFYSPLLGQVFTILTDQEVEVVLIELPYGGNHLIFEFR